MKSNSIRMKIALWTGACLLITIFFMVGYAGSNLYDASQQAAKNKVAAQADLEASKIESLIGTELGTLRALENMDMDRESANAILKEMVEEDPHLVGAMLTWLPNADGQDANYAGRTATGSSRTGRFAPHWIKGPDGQATLQTIPDAEIGASNWYTNAQELALQAQENEEEEEEEETESALPTEYIMPPTPGSDKIVVTLSMPLVSEGKFRGVAALELDLSFLQKEMQENFNLYNHHAEIIVVANNEVILVKTEDDPTINKTGQLLSEVLGDEWKKWMSEEENAAILRAQKTDIRIRKSVTGNEAKFFYFDETIVGEEKGSTFYLFWSDKEVQVLSPIKLTSAGTVWWIYMTAPNAIITRGAVDKTLWLVGFSLLIAALALAAIYLIARQLTNPIKEITAVSQAMARGNLSNHVSFHQTDEIGQLADAFRHMTTYLKEMARIADQLAEGDVIAEFKPQSDQDRLGNAFRRMIAYQQTMAETAQQIALGDLTVDITPQSDRDQLGKAFSEMIINTRNLARMVNENARSVSLAAEQLAAAAEQAGQATAQVSATIQQVAEGTTQQAQSVTHIASSVTQLGRAIDGIAKGAQEQSNAVNKSANVTVQINTTIQQVTSNARTSAQNSAQAALTARAGARTVEETIRGIETIRQRVELSAEKVREMGRCSEQIGDIIETIDDIASQTNLLALNAAIEAARAGEHGKGFAVVANAVRDLAEKSAEATKEIAGLIRTVQKTAAEATKAMDEGAAAVTAGVTRAGEAGHALHSIVNAAEESNNQVETIAHAAQQMDALATQLVSAMETVSAVVEENSASTEEMAANSNEVTQNVESIAGIAEENSAATEEVAATVEEVNAQVEEVTASAQSLNEMAQNLLSLVSRFILPEETPRKTVPRPHHSTTPQSKIASPQSPLGYS